MQLLCTCITSHCKHASSLKLIEFTCPYKLSPLKLEPFDSDHVSGGCAKGYDDQNINCFVADYGAYCEHLQRYHRTEQTLVCRPLSAVALLVVCLYRWSN